MKMSFKLTFWTMLLIIVIVLALSYFMNTNVSQEGFGSYNNAVTNNTKIKIVSYSSTKDLVKLYDCLYFDESTGNIIEVISTELPSAATGASDAPMTGINVINRSNGSVKKYTLTENEGGGYNITDDANYSTTIREGNNPFDAGANNSFVYDTEMEVPKYSVIIHANKNETLIHIMNQTTNNIIVSYLFSNGGTNDFVSYSNLTYEPQTPSTYRQNNKSGVGFFKRIHDNVVYDLINENVLISPDANNLYVISSDGIYGSQTVNMYASNDNDKERTTWFKNTSVGNSIIHFPSSSNEGVYITILELQLQGAGAGAGAGADAGAGAGAGRGRGAALRANLPQWLDENIPIGGFL